jgi:hypothetical protein
LTVTNRVLTIARKISDRSGEANALGSLGLAYNSLVDYFIAINYSQQSLTICQEIGDRKGEETALGNIGNFLLFARRLFPRH